MVEAVRFDKLSPDKSSKDEQELKTNDQLLNSQMSNKLN